MRGGGGVSKSMNHVTLGDKWWRAAYMIHNHQWRGYSFSSNGMAVKKGVLGSHKALCVQPWVSFIPLPVNAAHRGFWHRQVSLMNVWSLLLPGSPVPCLQHSVTPGPPPQSILHHRAVGDCKSRHQCWTLVHLPLRCLSPRFFLCITDSCRAGFSGSVLMYFLGEFSVQHCAYKLCFAAESVIPCAVFTAVMIVVMPMCILEHKTESHTVNHSPHYCSSEIRGMFAI